MLSAHEAPRVTLQHCIKLGSGTLSVTPALQRCRQKDQDFKALLGYTVSSRSDWTSLKEKVEIKTFSDKIW